MKKNESKHDPEIIPIEVERRGKFLIARHGGVTTVYRIAWEHDHGERHQNLIFHACPEIPRELEHLVYGPAKSIS